MRRWSAALVIVGSLLLSGCHRKKSELSMDNSAQTEVMIDALRDAYAAFNRGDIDAAVKPLDSDIEWREPDSFPGGGLYHGHEGVKHYLRQSRAYWAEGSSEPEEFIPIGNRIVVFVHARVRLQGSQEWHEVRLADVYTFQNGRAIQMRAFADREQALEWAKGKSRAQ